MGRIVALVPQLRPLLHPETVLLVDYDKAQACELHAVFYHGVRSDKYVYAAVGKPFEHLAPPFALHHARKQLYADIHAVKEGDYRLKMLLR